MPKKRQSSGRGWAVWLVTACCVVPALCGCGHDQKQQPLSPTTPLPDDVPGLLEVFYEGDNARSWQAVHALADMEGAATEALVAKLDAAEPHGVRGYAAHALAHTHPPPVERLREALGDGRSDKRDVLSALGRIGPAAADAMPDIALMLDSDDISERYMAAHAICGIRPQGADVDLVMPGLLRLMKEPDEHNARIAREAIGQIAPLTALELGFDPDTGMDLEL